MTGDDKLTKIRADLGRIRPSISELEAYARELKGIAGDVDGIRGNIRFKILSRASISSVLRDISEQISRDEKSMRAMYDGLEKIASRYTNTEENILEVWGEGNDSDWRDMFKDAITVVAKSYIISSAFPFISPSVGLLYMTGSFVWNNWQSFFDYSRSPSVSASVEGMGYEFSEGNPGITAWLGKAHAEAQNEWGYGEANAYVGKADASADFGFLTADEDGNLTLLKASAGASVAALSGDAKLGLGSDTLGMAAQAEGAVGVVRAGSDSEISFKDGKLNFYSDNEAIAAAAVGEVRGTVDVGIFEVAGTYGRYAGAVGVESKIGLNNNKFVVKKGAALGIGPVAGLEIGLSDAGKEYVNKYFENLENLIDEFTFAD